MTARRLVPLLLVLLSSPAFAQPVGQINPGLQDAANRSGRSGTVSAFDPALQVEGRSDGWQIRLPGARPLATAAVVDGTIFIGGGYASREVYALDAVTGETRWAIRVSDDGPTAAVVADGKVAFNTESCTLFVVDARTGEMLWSRWLGDPLMSQPAIAGGRVGRDPGALADRLGVPSVARPVQGPRLVRGPALVRDAASTRASCCSTSIERRARLSLDEGLAHFERLARGLGRAAHRRHPAPGHQAREHLPRRAAHGLQRGAARGAAGAARPGRRLPERRDGARRARPMYFAPEVCGAHLRRQARGAAVTAKTDVFALALSLLHSIEEPDLSDLDGVEVDDVPQAQARDRDPGAALEGSGVSRSSSRTSRAGSPSRSHAKRPSAGRARR